MVGTWRKNTGGVVRVWSRGRMEVRYWRGYWSDEVMYYWCGESEEVCYWKFGKRKLLTV